MTTARQLELLKIERECVMRNHEHKCDRNCAKCDLVQEDTDLIEMYDEVIGTMKYHIKQSRDGDIIMHAHNMQIEYGCKFDSNSIMCTACSGHSACELEQFVYGGKDNV